MLDFIGILKVLAYIFNIIQNINKRQAIENVEITRYENPSVSVMSYQYQIM